MKSYYHMAVRGECSLWQGRLGLLKNLTGGWKGVIMLNIYPQGLGLIY